MEVKDINSVLLIQEQDPKLGFRTRSTRQPLQVAATVLTGFQVRGLLGRLKLQLYKTWRENTTQEKLLVGRHRRRNESGLITQKPCIRTRTWHLHGTESKTVADGDESRIWDKSQRSKSLKIARQLCSLLILLYRMAHLMTGSLV